MCIRDSVQIALSVSGDGRDLVELTVLASIPAERFQEPSILVHFENSGAAEAVGDEDVPGSIPRYIRRPVETVAGSAGPATTSRSATGTRGRCAASSGLG